MKKTFTIDVTQEDIDHGECGRCYRCPVARAIKRAIGILVEVGDRYVAIFDKDRDSIIDYALPDVAVDFIAAFDAGAPVSPFSFPLTLDLPEAANV